MPPNRLLYLLRHAKSDWGEPGIEDHERPLAPRGQRATGLLADHVRAAGIAPDVVLVSSAHRTLQTLEGVAPPGERVIDPELYGASPGTVLAKLQSLGDDIGSAMVIGHNPTMQALVLQLGGSAAGDELPEVQRKFPTGALATLSFKGTWRDLVPGGARLDAYVHPRQLQGR
jgi:phosphohistidine phosphatase